ncbi:MAG: HAD family hydrolase [archaeon]
MCAYLILDLDDTLFPTSKFLIKARGDAAKAMIKKGLPEKSWRHLKEKIDKIVTSFGANYQQHFSRLCEEYGLEPDPRVIASGIVAYHNAKAEMLRPDPGVREILSRLRRNGHTLILISVGKPVKQWEKIERLGLEKQFSHITILDEKKGKNLSLKQKAFQECMKELSCGPSQMIVIGDRISSEIAAGNGLGMHTVRVLMGKRRCAIPSSPDEQADITIKSLSGLPGRIRELTRNVHKI